MIHMPDVSRPTLWQKIDYQVKDVKQEENSLIEFEYILHNIIATRTLGETCIE